MKTTCHYCTDKASEEIHAAEGCVSCCPRHAAWKKTQKTTPGHHVTCEGHVPFRKAPASRSSRPPPRESVS